MISTMRTYDLKLHVSYPQLEVDITICTIRITTAIVIPYPHLLIVPVIVMTKEIRASMSPNSYRGTEQEEVRIILALAGWQSCSSSMVNSHIEVSKLDRRDECGTHRSGQLFVNSKHFVWMTSILFQKEYSKNLLDGV